MKPGKLNRVLIIACVVLVVGLAGLYMRDTLLTNRVVARLSDFQPGTAFAEVVAANGPPDRIDAVSGSWKWGRRMRRVPENVTRVAVYSRAIAPQVCAFYLDAQDTVVEIERFAGY